MKKIGRNRLEDIWEEKKSCLKPLKTNAKRYVIKKHYYENTTTKLVKNGLEDIFEKNNPKKKHKTTASRKF